MSNKCITRIYYMIYLIKSFDVTDMCGGFYKFVLVGVIWLMIKLEWLVILNGESRWVQNDTCTCGCIHPLGLREYRSPMIFTEVQSPISCVRVCTLEVHAVYMLECVCGSTHVFFLFDLQCNKTWMTLLFLVEISYRPISKFLPFTFFDSLPRLKEILSNLPEIRHCPYWSRRARTTITAEDDCPAKCPLVLELIMGTNIHTPSFIRIYYKLKAT